MRKSPRSGARCLAALLAVLWVGAAAPSRADSDPVSDPLERMNRGIFWFNDRLDRYFLEPVAKGWDWIMPDLVQESLENVYDNGPFTLRYETEVNVLRDGRVRSIKTQGWTTQADRKRFRFEFSMETTTTETDSSTSTNTNVIGTSDGEVFWLEVHNVTAGRHRAFKMPVDKLESAARRNHPIAQYIAGMDPVSQIRKLTTMFDFEVGSRSEDSVTLVAEVSDEILGRVGPTLPGDPSKLGDVTITFDTRTEFPTEVRFGEETPVMWIGITEFEYLDDIDEAMFRYEAPEGVDVVDFGKMSRRESQPQGQPRP